MKATLFDDQRNDLWRIDLELPCGEEKIRILLDDELKARRLLRDLNGATSVLVVPNSW